MQEIPSTAQWIVESGLSVSLLAILVWIVKAAFSSIKEIIAEKDKQLADASKAVQDIVKLKDQQLQAANEKYYELSESMLEMMERFHKDESEQKDILISILSRMEEKLNQPVRCPSAIADRQGV